MELDYTKYNKQIQKWMQSLESTLREEMDDLPESFALQLALLADNLDIYLRSKKQLDEEGLTIRDSRGGLVKHPAISIYNASSLNINKLLVSFGLTRMAKSRLRENTSQMDALTLIESLTQ